MYIFLFEKNILHKQLFFISKYVIIAHRANKYFSLLRYFVPQCREETDRRKKTEAEVTKNVTTRIAKRARQKRYR